MRVDTAYLVVAFAGGAALGIFYFVLLWKTVERLTMATRPVLLAAASFFGRASVVVAGFYLLSGGSWKGLVAAFAGFLLARAFCLRSLGRTRAAPPLPSPNEKEGCVPEQ